MNDALVYALGVLIAIVGLAISIGLHEMGHFVPARIFGVYTPKFMIGFGPTIWSKRRGETEYGVKALPLGGFVSLYGMYPPEAKDGKRSRFFNNLIQDARTASRDTDSDVEIDESRAFYRLSTWKKLIVMAGGPAMNFVIALALFGFVVSVFGVPQTTTTVATVSQCVVPASAAAEECAVDAPPSPAFAAGIQPGDTIVRIDGQDVREWSDVARLVGPRAGEDTEVVVERDGVEVSLQLTPALNERYVLGENGQVAEDAAGNPVTEQIGFIGVGPTNERVTESPLSAFGVVGERIAGVGEMLANFPARVVDAVAALFGAERNPNSPVSVVGVGMISGEVAAQDQLPIVDRASALLELLAGLNIALGVINLVPLPPLDGGHIAGALWQGIRNGLAKLFKRPNPGPVDMAKLVPVTITVSVLLMGLGGLFILVDIVNPISLFG